MNSLKASFIGLALASFAGFIALAPVCPHCNCRIVGHGVEADGKIFCCVHCARVSGTTQLKDRV